MDHQVVGRLPTDERSNQTRGIVLNPHQHRASGATAIGPAHGPGMSIAQPSRVPAGVPAGGRFSASQHTDPGTDVLERTDPVTERELFDRFSASARHWGNRLGVDSDDLLQDTAVEFYATLARQRAADDPQPGLNGRGEHRRQADAVEDGELSLIHI